MAARYGPQSIGQRVTRFCQPPIIVFDAPRDSVHLKLIKTHPANYSCHVSSAIRQIKARVLARNTRAKSWPYEKVLRVPRNAASTFYLHWYLLENVTGKRQREEKINRSQEAEKQREREREREMERSKKKARFLFLFARKRKPVLLSISTPHCEILPDHRFSRCRRDLFIYLRRCEKLTNDASQLFRVPFFSFLLSIPEDRRDATLVYDNVVS